MQLEQVIAAYQHTIKEEQIKLKKLKSTIFQIGSIRLAMVFVCGLGIYYLWFDVGAILIFILINIVIFLTLMKYHNKLFYRKHYCELLIKNAENELKAINYDFSAFDGAPERADGVHSFSNDLDLFGNRAFFRTINRTVTNYGKEELARKFEHPSDQKEDILKSQIVVKELTQKTEFLKHLRATGQISDAKHLDLKNFATRFENSKSLASSLWRFAPFIPIVLVVIFIGLAIAFNMPDSLGSIVYVILVITSLIPLKWINEKMSFFEKNIESLETYSSMFKLIEDESFVSEELINLQKQIKQNKTASLAIHQLSKLSHNLSQSQNALGFLVLNPFAFWNVIYAIKIEKWVKENKDSVDKWFDALAQFDAYASLSIFSYNNPSYSFPEVADHCMLEAKELGHPMLRRDVCVTNDVSIAKHPYFLVVTGANMAGKSTYLRTVGLNLVLACVGAPVFAQSFKFFPFHLITNLKTSDSLADNESYFFAELKRLKMIIDRLESGEQLFIILDEILKGTNSEDKQKGSIALMKQLIANKGCGIIATHDLILGNLEQEYPNEVKNYRFEADITNNELTFTYKIREGVAQNMNACFLMKKMGIAGLD